MFRILLFIALVSASYGAILPTRRLELTPIPPAGRIMGGEVTTIEEVPYQVAILSIFSNALRCGGSIVTRKAVISSISCVSGITASSMGIRSGSSRYNAGGAVINARNVFSHDRFNANTLDYDICIIELLSPIVFSTTADSITLATQSLTVPDGSNCQTSGWGYYSESQYPSPYIRKLQISTVNQDTCKGIFNALGYQITPRMICAGLFEEGGKGFCAGDIGGPLVLGDVLIGVTSWARGCGEAGFPQIWSRISESRNWIDETLSKIN